MRILPVSPLLETEQAFLAELAEIIDLKIDLYRMKIENGHIIRLNLAQTHLSRLPSTISKLTALKELILRGNQLTLLPENLDQLSVLQRFDVAENQLTILPREIGQISTLEHLNLHSNHLKILPDSICGLKLLEELDLHGNRLVVLPECIGQLSALQKLDLEGNRLVVLPKSINELSVLQKLNLRGNLLVILPENFGGLMALHDLNLRGNQLSSLPVNIGRLPALQTIDLGKNKIITLPDSICLLSALQMLNLNGNLLTVLPEAIGHLSLLQWLVLSDNQLIELPISMGHLSVLQELVMDNNPLSDLPIFNPFHFYDKHSCQEFLQHFFRWLPSVFIPWLEITLHYQNLSEFDSWAEHWPYWVKYRDDLFALCERYPGPVADRIRHLIETKERVQLAPSTYGLLHGIMLAKPDFDLMITLEKQLGEALPEVAEHTRPHLGFIARDNRVVELKLIGRQLTILPENIGQLTALEKLDLGRNQITVLPSSINQFTVLHTMDLHKNLLDSLPESIGQLTALKNLDLRENPLSDLPPIDQRYFSNSIKCQEFLSHFRDWAPDIFIPRLEIAFQNQTPLESWSEKWPYWVKYRDFLLAWCDRYPGVTADRIRVLIESKERVKLTHSDYEILL